MRALRFFLFAILISFSAHLSAREAERIEALLLIDSKSNLNKSVKKDGQMMLSTLQKVADAAKMKLKATVLCGNDVEQQHIQEWLDNLKNNSHDVIFFYFSGHGFKDEANNIPWPYLYLSARNKALSLQSIIQHIEGLPSRLSIIFSDCCNGPLLTKRHMYAVATKAPMLSYARLYEKGATALFMKAKGHIRATAASPGQSALAFSSGSLFTMAFSESLLDECQVKSPSWKNLFVSTSKICGTLQQPYVVVEVR